jgi:Xaa-Pro aminopeptidase
VHTMHPTLLLGPADWDAARLPRAEFLERATAFWRRCPAAAGAIVYGGRAQHAELAYLTNFTPKLEAALALIPRVGAAQLLVGGGPNMVQAARPLTFIENVRPLRNVGEAVAQWTREQSGGGRPVLIGGAAMPYPLRRQIDEAAGKIADKTADLRMLMRRKSERELAAMREACVALEVAVDAMTQAQHAGAGTTDAVLSGERAAWRAGAQDVRTLFSIDDGRTLRPFDAPVERAVDPLQVYVAVCRFGYWAEGFAVLTASPNPCARGAGDALRYAIEMIRPGHGCSDVARAITAAIHPLGPHPVTAHVVGNAIGLALEEQPLITAASVDTFETGGVYSLRVGVSGQRGDCAIVSAMIAVHEHGNDMLWCSPEAPT